MLMFPLPQNFDLNEWVVLIASVVMVGVFFLLPRRFPRYFTVMNILFTTSLVMSVDDVLAVPPYDYYDWMDSETFELFDLFTYFFLYPMVGYIFLYLYDRWGLRGWKLLLYILSWTCFSIGFEWMCVVSHVLTYKGWSLYFSMPVYLVVFGIELSFFLFVQKYSGEKL